MPSLVVVVVVVCVLRSVMYQLVASGKLCIVVRAVNMIITVIVKIGSQWKGGSEQVEVGEDSKMATRVQREGDREEAEKSERETSVDGLKPALIFLIVQKAVREGELSVGRAWEP